MKIHYVVLLTLLLGSCERSFNMRELNIEVISKSGELSVGNYVEPIFYPNPFVNYTVLLVGNSKKFTVNITSVEGLKKIESDAQEIFLNFRNESKGAYNAEVLVNGKVYRYTLIKGAE